MSTDRICIVGGGRIGGMLRDLADTQGIATVLVDRANGAEVLGTPLHAPIVVCTRNDALEQVVAWACPENRPDLVFVQNGMIQPWLDARGLGGCTQGVLYVAVQRRGDTPVPGASSVFWGPHAATLARLLDGGGVHARVALDVDDFATEVGVKLAWICALGPLAGATGLTVGEVCDRHPDALATLCAEIAAVLVHEPGVRLDPAWLTDRVVAYTRSVAHYNSAIKEWPWRNGWLVAAAARHGVDLPVHADWVARAGVADGSGPAVG